MKLLVPLFGSTPFAVAFVNNCKAITLGVPQCHITFPFVVQIRPSTNEAPDPSIVLASFFLSHDNNPLVISYESTAINLPLEAGTYFALFVPQGDDAGFLLGTASIPLNYRADAVTMGCLGSSCGTVPVFSGFGAVKILGNLIPELITININPNTISLRSRGIIQVAILSTSSFNAPTTVRMSSLTFGRTGNEQSLIRCNTGDANADGLPDLICQFDSQRAAFQAGDTTGILKGVTIEGTPFQGEDAVRIIP